MRPQAGTSTRVPWLLRESYEEGPTSHAQDNARRLVSTYSDLMRLIPTLPMLCYVFAHAMRTRETLVWLFSHALAVALSKQR